MDDKNNGNAGLVDERRQHKRKALKLNKVFAAKVGQGLDVMPLYIFIVDISLGGMKITTDFNLPEMDPFHMEMKLDEGEILDTDVEVRWKKKLIGGTYMMGVKFLDVPEHVREIIRNFMARHSAEGKRKTFRLDRVLAVEMDLEDKEEKFYTLTMDLSPQGMRLTNPFPLPEDKDINLKMMLDFEDRPVSMKAKVRWQKETSYDRYMIGLEFIDITENDSKRINRYIDRAISGEFEDMIYDELPTEVFDKPIKRYDDDLGRRGDYLG